MEARESHKTSTSRWNEVLLCMAKADSMREEQEAAKAKVEANKTQQDAEKIAAKEEREVKAEANKATRIAKAASLLDGLSADQIETAKKIALEKEVEAKEAAERTKAESESEKTSTESTEFTEKTES